MKCTAGKSTADGRAFYTQFIGNAMHILHSRSIFVFAQLLPLSQVSVGFQYGTAQYSNGRTQSLDLFYRNGAVGCLQKQIRINEYTVHYTYKEQKSECAESVNTHVIRICIDVRWCCDERLKI